MISLLPLGARLYLSVSRIRLKRYHWSFWTSIIYLVFIHPPFVVGFGGSCYFGLCCFGNPINLNCPRKVVASWLKVRIDPGGRLMKNSRAFSSKCSMKRQQKVVLGSKLIIEKSTAKILRGIVP